MREVALRLAVKLGRNRVFFDEFHEAELARPGLDALLTSVYRYQSELVVAFIGRDYAKSDWCGLEWRGVRDLIKNRKTSRVMLIRVDDGEIEGLLSIDHALDAGSREPEEIAELILDRLSRVRSMTASGAGNVPTETKKVSRPGVLRHFLDRWLPRMHLNLTRLGTLSEPPEMGELHAYLRDRQAAIEDEIREKTYLPLQAKSVPSSPLGERPSDDPFVSPVRQVVHQILGRAEGGDSASAEIAAVNRRSKLVRNILSELRRSQDPLVLLGDPGSGKTMTLQQTMLAWIRAEIHHVFPIIPIYVRLGEFHVESEVGPREVFAFVKRSAPEEIRPFIEELDRERRLVVIFDGMDEMSRQRYNEHTEALSFFAGQRKAWLKTLFSCRITDFSPAFGHRRLVLLPFDEKLILDYLRRYLLTPKISIGGKTWTLRQLARRLMQGDLAVDVTNPFALWLLCIFLQERDHWPDSRVQLLEFFNRRNYARKCASSGADCPAVEEVFEAWALFAFEITRRNRGSAILVADLIDLVKPLGQKETLGFLQLGKICGVFEESVKDSEYQIRFEHHRFQEYFAALHIYRRQPSINWLDKLDAPRWQETMLNLLMMGGGEEATRTLVESIQAPIERLRSSGDLDEPEEEDGESSLPSAVESQLADRVELAARLYRACSRQETDIAGILAPCLEESVGVLVDQGNPITQVKMMRAFQKVDDLDLHATLQKPLRSRIKWVREQALILVAARKMVGKGTSSSLPVELGFDLANNSVLRHSMAYWRATRGSSRIHFLAAVLLTLCRWSMNALGGVLIYLAAQELLSDTSSAGVFLSSFVSQAFFGTLLISTAAVAFTRLSSGQWIATLGVSLVYPSLVIVGFALWEGMSPGELILWAIVLYVMLVFFNTMCWVYGILGSLGCLSIYLLFTKLSSGVPRRSFYSVNWRNGFFADVLGKIWKHFVWVTGTGIFISGMTWLGSSPIAGVIQSYVAPTLKTLSPILLLFLGGLFALILLAGIIQTFLDDWVDALRSFLDLLAAAVGLLAAYAVIAGLVYLLMSHLLIFGRVLVVVVLLTAIATLSFWAVKAMRHVDTWALKWKNKLPPQAFSKEQWIERIRNAADATEQKEILARTLPGSLSLTARQYLKLLEQIEELIREDPAASAYWARRDQMDQALKQERPG